MADNGTTEIKGKIVIDTGASAKTITELNTAIKQTRQNLADATIGSKEHKAALEQLAAQQKTLKSVTDSSNESHGKSTAAFGALKDKVTGMVPALKGAESGAMSFNGVLKILSANPIVIILGVIVGLLKFLYEAFTSTREGAEKVEAIFAGVSAAVQVVVDRVMKLGGAIIKFFSGDFKGAWADAKGAVSGIGDEIEAVYNRTVELTKQLQAIKKEEIADNLDKSVRQKRLAQLKEMMGDEDVSAKQRLQIAKELRDDAIKNSADDLDRTRRKINAEIELIKMKANWEKDHLEEVTNLQIELNNTETENAMEVFRVNKQVKSAQKEIDSENKQRSDAAKAAAKTASDAAKARRTELMAVRTQIAKQEQEIELATMKEGQAKELTILNNSLADKKAATAAQLADKKIDAEQAATLDANAERLNGLARSAVIDKYRQQEKAKEKTFRDELVKLRIDIELQGIEDSRLREQKQLDISYDDKFKQAREKYKDNEKALFAITIAISLQQRQAQALLEKKYETEDQKTARETSLKRIAFETSLAKNDLSAKRKLLEEKQQIIDDQYRDELAAAENNATKKAAVEQKHIEDLYAFSEAKKAIDNAERDNKIKALDAVASTLDNASKLIGEKTALGKAFAVVSATISMFTSAQKAYESTVGIPVVGPFLAPINAGLAIAAGIKNIKAITSVKVPGQADAGGSVSAPTIASAPVAPQSTSTALNQSSINGIGNAAQGGVGRSFVLDSDISNNNERRRRITRAARLG